MLTLANIRQFRRTLEDLSFQCDELLKTRERQLIFENAEQKEDALIFSEKCPQDYFKFQLFDRFIELNKDNKGYYVYSENFLPTDSKLMSYRNGFTSQYRLNGLDFCEAKKVFIDFCLNMIHVFTADFMQLFYIY